MGWFGKKDKVIDLGERYRKNQERISKIKETAPETREAPGQEFDFFGSLSSPATSEESANPEEKKKKLAKRLIDITEKIEDLSNQIYHLQQRIETLERKAGIGSSG